MKRKTIFVFSAFALILAASLMASASLVVYNDFALVTSNDVIAKSANTLLLPTTDSPVPGSLVTSVKINGYTFHGAESYSLESMLENFVGSNVQFLFRDKTLKTLRVVSAKPIVLQDPQTGGVYFDPRGEFIFPMLPGIDSKNYFVASTSATGMTYSYLSSNIGWKGVYTLDLGDSVMNGNVTLWNRTKTNFRNFDLAFVAGNPNISQSRSNSAYEKTAVMMAAADFSQPGSVGGYKVYRYGAVDRLDADSTAFIPLFYKKVKIEKLNVAYNPSSNFQNAVQVAKMTHDFPIPQGTVSVYTTSNGVKYFLGQSSITDSASMSELDIPYGDSFDLEARQVEQSRVLISKDVYRYTYEVTASNSSKDAQGLWIYEQVAPGSVVTVPGGQSVRYERISSAEIHFYVDLKPNSKDVFTYSVQRSY